MKVPYAEKDVAKKLGAKWDSGKKVWYVRDVENIKPFMRWIPKHLLRPHGKHKTHQPKRTKPSHNEPLYNGDVPPWD